MGDIMSVFYWRSAGLSRLLHFPIRGMTCVIYDLGFAKSAHMIYIVYMIFCDGFLTVTNFFIMQFKPR